MSQYIVGTKKTQLVMKVWLTALSVRHVAFSEINFYRYYNNNN